MQSEFGLITHGLQQGSVLGPVLFIVLVIDLPHSVSRSVADIYADDTTLSASTAAENRMLLNASKTKSLVLTYKRLEKKVQDKSLKIHVMVQLDLASHFTEATWGEI